MLSTRFTELVGCTAPVQQAGIGGFAIPRLAAAVANAGGMGMVCVYGLTPAQVAGILDSTRAQTSGVFGANFIMRFVKPDLADECVAAAAARANIVDFFYSDPDPRLVEIVHSAGALACWQVGSLEEAVAAVDAGCDFIIAQGIEAGGHVRGQIGLMALLNQVLDVVNVPVLAAGGIGTGRNMAAALAAGADGVRIGTRFVAAEEADAHPDYVNALIAAGAKDTIFTGAFSNTWPDAPHRCLRSCVDAALAFEGDLVGEAQDSYTGNSYRVHRLEPMTIGKSTTGVIGTMPHWAGELVDAVKRVQPAAEIVRELVDECEKSLRRWC